MSQPHLVIVGGGVAGLSAGVYAQRSGFRTTIVEHNLTLGGVCTAWHRGPYTVDGSIHWLTGGPFSRVYDELGILAEVPLRTLDAWTTYRDAVDGLEISVTSDLGALIGRLTELAPEDADELARVRHGASQVAAMSPPFDAEETMSFRDGLRLAWEMRGAFGAMVHFRKPVGEWAAQHLSNPRLRRIACMLVPETAPAAFLLMVLGYLERGFLSRPVGGTAAFRAALEKSYRALGGEVLLHATADEILVSADRATGVRLADGRLVEADAVVCTSSMPETALRLLGGRYDGGAVQERIEAWKLFEPIVLASFGVDQAYADAPTLMQLDGVPAFSIGGRMSDHLYVRTCNDDECFAPPGHTVVQVLAPTDYGWWATRGARYHEAKDEVASTLLDRLAPHFPGIRDGVRMTDVATPLTFWNMARSWRGAYEGWMPTSDSFFGHVGKTLPGLGGFYMAGQWVEPGGGVPVTALSGRKAVQLLCSDLGRGFVAS